MPAARYERASGWLGALAGVVAAAAGGSSPGGLAIATSGLVSLLLVGAPLVGVVVVLFVRQVVDCFWASPVLTIGSGNFDAKAILGIFVPAAIVVALWLHGWRPRRSRLWVPIAAYVGVSALGVIPAAGKLDALNYLARIALPFCFLALGLHLGEDRRAGIVICCAIAGYALLAAVSGGLQAAGLISPLEGAVSKAGALTRITGFYHHPLDVGLRCGVALPFAFFLFERSSPGVPRTAALAWLVTLIVVGFCTLVRSTLVALSIETLAWLWLGRARKLAVALLIGGMSLGAAIPDIRAVVVGAIRPIEEGRIYEAGSGRALIFAAQVAAFLDGNVIQKAVGRGLGSSARMTILYNPVPVLDLGGAGFEEGEIVAHNQILRVLVESGVLGLGALALVMISFFRGCTDTVRGAKHGVERTMGRAGIVLIIGLSIFSISSVPLDAPSITWPAWLGLGVVLSSGRRPSSASI